MLFIYFFAKDIKKHTFFAILICICITLSFSLSQSVTNTTFSMRVSVWMIVLRATLPASSNRSVCVATLIVRHVTDRASMTVMCVATWKLSATMESVCLSVPATLTMTRPPMNAEVGKVEVVVVVFCSHKTKWRNKQFYFNITHLFIDCPDFSQSVPGHVWPAQAMNPPPASAAIPTGVKMPADTACGSLSALCAHTRTRMGSANSVTKPVIAVLGQAKTNASAAISHTSYWVSYYCLKSENMINFSVEKCFISTQMKLLILCLCPSDDTCVLKCPVGYYAEDKDERVCERCHFSCQSCVGRHSLQCVDCKAGFFKQGRSCVEICSDRLDKRRDAQSLLSSPHRTSQTKPPPSFSVTLATPPPWFASNVTPLVLTAGVAVTETVWAVERTTSTWGSGDSACRAALQASTKTSSLRPVTNVTPPARPAAVSLSWLIWDVFLCDFTLLNMKCQDRVSFFGIFVCFLNDIKITEFLHSNV